MKLQFCCAAFDHSEMSVRSQHFALQKGPDPPSDPVLRSDQVLRELSGADQ